MASAATKVVSAKRNALTVSEVRTSMKEINSSERNAKDFLTRIGVSVSKNGKVKVRPI